MLTYSVTSYPSFVNDRRVTPHFVQQTHRA